MRVNGEPAEGAAPARKAEPGRPFGEALARARGGAERTVASRGVPAAAKDAATRRSSADRGAAVLRERRTAFRDDQRTAADACAPQGAIGALPRAAAGETEAPASLRAAIRTLPAAIQAAHVREGAPLELALGRALSVELRSGRGGVEVVLRPEARLARDAAAELPGLVRALRARGVAVARAEVHSRGAPAAVGPQVGGEARVDCGRGLR